MMDYEHNGRRVYEDRNGNLDWDRYESELLGVEMWNADRFDALIETLGIEDPWNWEMDDLGMLRRAGGW